MTPVSLSRRRFLYLTGGMGVVWAASTRGSAELLGAESAPSLPPLPARVGDVNTTSIRSAIELGCRTMGRVFNADDHDVPFFNTQAWPVGGLYFSSSHSEAHVPGRHLNALLSAENVLGLRVPEEVVNRHANAAYFSFSGPVAMPLNRETVGGPLRRFLPHNIREGLHAMYALVRFRDSRRARDTAERCIAAMLKYWNPVRGWDRDYFEKELGLVFVEGAGGHTFITGIARALGPLVKYYRATEHRPALELALLIKEKALAECFLPDGSYDAGRLGFHTHSVACVLSSLAQLFEVTGETRILDRVRAFLDHGAADISDGIGWTVEMTNNVASPDRGEANSTGDLVEACLILGAKSYPEYYGRAERMLRCHLLPSQLRDVSFMAAPPNPANEDGKRDVADRQLGAFGFPAPYGHKPVEGTSISFNLDIVGGVVGSLCEAYRHVTTSNESGHRVNLLFSHETDAVKVTSPYPDGVISVVVKQAAPLSIRVPSWADRGKVRVNQPASAWQWRDDFLHVPHPPVGEKISVTLELPASNLVLAHRTRAIRVRLRGDEVASMDNFGAPLAFFPAYT